MPAPQPEPPPSRPDGSLPFTPRWWRDDPYRRARQAIGIPWIHYHAAEPQRRRLVETLNALEDEAVDWMRRYREALDEAQALHDALWPPMARDWAPRPPRPDEAPMPPYPARPTPINGRALRHVVTTLVQRHGELCLRDVRRLLILHGFDVAARNDVKAVADAAGREAAARRLTRVGRGRYRAGPLRLPPYPTDPLLRDAPEDWYPVHARTAHRAHRAHRAGPATLPDPAAPPDDPTNPPAPPGPAQVVR